MNSKGVDETAAVSILGKRKLGASTSASSSSSTTDSVSAATVYDVFLSFRGEDTRKRFTDHLYHNLVGANIQTFRDNVDLRVGEQIGPELLKAIKESKSSIPIFSQNYATSKWCLLELEQIVECHKKGGHKIFPIFYDVDPSDGRNQTGSYEVAFSLHETKFDESTVKGWRDALKVVGELKGLELKKEADGHEGEFVKKVVEKVVMELNKNYTDVPRNLVGMHKHINKLMVLLEVDSDDVRIVGIHGMGGSGKTTMTKVTYNKMCNNFDGQCFFDNVREKSKDDNGFAEMQNRISSVSDGRNWGKKLLLVLDDVDDYIQIDRLMEELNRFGASTSASSSSSTTDSVSAATVYDVFLSFRGEDTRKRFTDHLYHNLVGANIQTFRDNVDLRVGEQIGPELLKAIKESKSSIPIFSQNYATSKWCLLELEQIVECHKKGGHKIFPIFYDVDPSDVRHQRGSYELAFRLHEEKFDKNTVQRWRDALKVVGELSGFELADGHEGEFVKKVVEKVVMELNKNYTDVPQNLVGMHKHINKLMVLLEVDSDDVRIVGIHGMGGSGKTTMAKVIYNQLCNNFYGQRFFDNVREKSKDNDGVEMQNRISSFSAGSNSGKKLLLVLDDVDDYKQINMLMEELKRFGAGSRIILTTRNKAVLDKIETILRNQGSSVVCRNYKPGFMDKSYSLQLFSKYAFKKDFPMEEYNILSQKVVDIAAGLPLALVVLGSTFFAFDKDIWEEKVEKLRRTPHKEVLEKLMFSFDALDNTEKEIFLDIACFFIGDKKTRPTYMWQSCKLYPYSGIQSLVSRSLITINDDDEFQMHDQLRDLGREIVLQENLHLPGNRSRLLDYEEASRVLESNQGTSFVNALRLQSHNSVVARQFYHLPNLRYLCMNGVTNVDGDFKDLLPNLRWLECQLKLDNSSLRNLNMKNLVVLDLSFNDELTDEWDGWRQLKMTNNLKVLDLSYCHNLQTLPNLSNLTKLVELCLRNCSSLRRIPNISSLKELKVFNAEFCLELRQIEGVSGLISLEYLELYGCDSLKEGLGDLSNLNNLQVLKGSLDLTTDLSNFKKLKVLYIYGSYKNEIQNLDGLEALEELEIRHCSSMVRLPNLSYLNRLNTLVISWCMELIEIPDLSELKSLENLTISWCWRVEALPDLSPLQKLRKLDVSVCENLSEIRGIEELKCLKDLYIIHCERLGHLLELDLPNVRIISKIGGVESAALHGEEKDQIQVIGEGIDAAELTKLLRKKVGPSQILSVEPVDKKKEDEAKKKEEEAKKNVTMLPAFYTNYYQPNYGYPVYEVVRSIP